MKLNEKHVNNQNAGSYGKYFTIKDLFHDARNCYLQLTRYTSFQVSSATRIPFSEYAFFWELIFRVFRYP